tara:strand:- start:2396 stop:3127 length:732 start_codon:yes stop_codon:yes gene_type:complete
MGKNKELTIQQQLQSLNQSAKQIKDLQELFSLVEDHQLGNMCFSTSLGQEDQVLTDFIFKNNLPIDVFTLDTGRLFQESYDVLSSTQKKYQKTIQTFFPNDKEVEELVAKQGINGFYETVQNRKDCCTVRKINPLKRALQPYDIWVTGLRSEQSVNRSGFQIFTYDTQFEIIKFNPLLQWSYEEVLDYIESHNVPQNSLHKQGYISIGCAPCTRAITADEDPRAGRWWWETSHKECGLHKTNN